MNIPVIHFPDSGYLGCLHFGVAVSHAMNVLNACLFVDVFFFLLDIPRSGIVGHVLSVCLSFKKLSNCFQSACIILHP